MDYQKQVPDYSLAHQAQLKLDNDTKPSLWITRKRMTPEARKELFKTAVEKLNSLKANYDDIIDDRMKTKRERVEIVVKKGVGKAYIYNFTIDSWECQLEVKKFLKKDDEAKYYIFNDFDSICYIRNLMELPI